MKIIEANTFFKRLFGLTFKTNLKYGMIFNNCRSIHTFFMKCNIDIFILNKSNEIIEFYPNIKKNKIIISHLKDSYSVLELPSNSSKYYHLKDKIKMKRL